MRSATLRNVFTRAWVVGRLWPVVRASVDLSSSANGEFITNSASGARVLHMSVAAMLTIVPWLCDITVIVSPGHCMRILSIKFARRCAA
ncbi:hypothetical protein AWB82_07258 [Caballeronia glebae]|uniref:Uncharacterized protein n=1 Tax=Caballeronia glebae TaxID=1777143 RepID=A0A158DWH0_9BURK|nr:hypothetical protein AWB82_07258 [Caballeronia glebae]